MGILSKYLLYHRLVGNHAIMGDDAQSSNRAAAGNSGVGLRAACVYLLYCHEHDIATIVGPI
jgi:hypothetical protein